MKFYHYVHDDQEGDILMPLNMLRYVYPKVYEQKAAKYKGREALMKVVIPKLACLWNDVLFLMPVHPGVIRQSRLDVGLEVPPSPQRYYEIDSASLVPQFTYVYRYDLAEKEGIRDRVPEDLVELFDPRVHDHLSILPEKTREYYRQKKVNGGKVFPFIFVPHILYRAVIDTRQLPVLVL